MPTQPPGLPPPPDEALAKAAEVEDALPRPSHKAATLMLRAGVDPHRVGTARPTARLGHDHGGDVRSCRDRGPGGWGVKKIGPHPWEPSRVADSLRTPLGSAPAANEDKCPKLPEN